MNVQLSSFAKARHHKVLLACLLTLITAAFLFAPPFGGRAFAVNTSVTLPKNPSFPDGRDPQVATCKARLIGENKNSSLLEPLLGDVARYAAVTDGFIGGKYDTNIGTKPDPNTGWTAQQLDTATSKGGQLADDIMMAYLKPSHLQYLMQGYNTSQVPVIRFEPGDAASLKGPDGFNPDVGSVCSTLVMVPVSTNEWRAPQGDSARLGGSVWSPSAYMRFVVTSSSNGVTKGDLYYYTGGYFKNPPAPSPNPDYIIIRDFEIDQDIPWGGTVGNTDVNTIPGKWLNVANIQLTGTKAEESGTFTKSTWDASQGRTIYFLSQAPDTPDGIRKALVQARKCRDPFTDAGLPINQCPETGYKTNCVPFVAIDKPINFSRPSGTSNGQLSQLQSRIDGLAGGTATYYDYNNATDCIASAPRKLDLSFVGDAKIWFAYSATAKAFQTLFIDGDGNERIYLGMYGQVAGDSYAGGVGNCAGVITTTGPIPADGAFTINWKLGKEDIACTTDNRFYGFVNVEAVGGAAGEALFTQASGLRNDLLVETDTATPPQLNCDVTVNPLTWIMCPIIAGAQLGIEALDSGINKMLSIKVNDYFDETCDPAKPDCNGAKFYIAWNNLRILATAVVVIAALVMVIAQAAGLEILDAYTVKKILPRLLLAVIGISLSWELCKEFIRLSEVLGLGVRNIIYAPFSGMGGAAGVYIGAGASSALAIVGGITLLGLGIFATLSFVLTAFLAILVAFAVLTFRQIAVIFLAILAPLAIAMSILPGTQKAWKFWWDSFSKMLLMFPIITAFIAAGRVFAQISSKPDDLFYQLIGFIAYLAPYFLIPATFRLAGGLIATVGGMVNDRSRGAFDRLKNYRAGALKKNMENLRTGNRFKGTIPGTRRLAKGMNAFSEGVATFANAESKFGFLTNRNSRNAAYEQQRSINRQRWSQTERGQAAKENDPLLIAQTYRSALDARRNMAQDWGMTAQAVDAAVRSAEANGGFGSMQQDYATRRLAATGTGYANMEQMHRTVARVAGANRERASSLLGEINAVTKGVGRHDLAAGYGTHMQMYDAVQARGGIQAVVATGAPILTADEVQNAYIEAVKGTDAVTLERDKTQAINNTMPALRQALVQAQQAANNGALSVAQRQTAAADAARFTGMIESLAANSAYASPNNIQATADLVVTPTAGQQPGIIGPVSNIGNRQEAIQAASPVLLEYNPTTGVMEPVYRRYAPGTMIGGVNVGGQIIRNPRTGQQEAEPNPAYDPTAAQAYNPQRPRGTLSPNDPRYGT